MPSTSEWPAAQRDGKTWAMPAANGYSRIVKQDWRIAARVRMARFRFVGITAGATFAGALQVGAQAPDNANVLCMLPDTGQRYLSTPLFAGVPADMTAEELDILRSTPSAQFPA